MDQLARGFIELLGQAGRVRGAQTTYIDISLGPEFDTEFRIHFGKAKRRSVQQTNFESLFIDNDHPLCLNESSATKIVTIHQGPSQAFGLLEALESATRNHFDGCLGIEDMFNPYFLDADSWRPDAFGTVVQGNLDYLTLVVDILEGAGVKLNLISGRSSLDPVWALRLDTMYVVASEFRLEKIESRG